MGDERTGRIVPRFSLGARFPTGRSVGRLNPTDTTEARGLGVTGNRCEHPAFPHLPYPETSQQVQDVSRRSITDAHSSTHCPNTLLAPTPDDGGTRRLGGKSVAESMSSNGPQMVGLKILMLPDGRDEDEHRGQDWTPAQGQSPFNRPTVSPSIAPFPLLRPAPFLHRWRSHWQPGRFRSSSRSPHQQRQLGAPRTEPSINLASSSSDESSPEQVSAKGDMSSTQGSPEGLHHEADPGEQLCSEVFAFNTVGGATEDITLTQPESDAVRSSSHDPVIDGSAEHTGVKSCGITIVDPNPLSDTNSGLRLGKRKRVCQTPVNFPANSDEVVGPPAHSASDSPSTHKRRKFFGSRVIDHLVGGVVGAAATFTGLAILGAH